VSATEQGLAFPARDQGGVEEEDTAKAYQENDATKSREDFSTKVEKAPTEETTNSQASTIAAGSDIDTPSTSQEPSEADSTHPTTPSSAMPPPHARPATAGHNRTATIPAIPLIPIKPARAPSATSATQKPVTPGAEKGSTELNDVPPAAETKADDSVEDTPKSSLPPKAEPPKSWAELLRAKNAPVAAHTPATPNGTVAANGPTTPKSNSLADTLASFSVNSLQKVTFLEPRGLVNSGNLCYMNSVSASISFQASYADYHRFFKFYCFAFLSITS
jgi:ubiquitin carboxyl-terminal hydrolase 10